MHSLLQDIRFAFRQLRNSIGFTVLAVVTLGFGIGANTAMFTVTESVLLRPLPYSNSDRLVYIGPSAKEGFTSTSWLNYLDIRNQATALQSVACFATDIGVVETKTGTEAMIAPGMTPSAFPLLGVKPLLGRTFTDDEGQSGGPRAAVLSEGLWRENFQADPQILGQTIRINGKARTVVGVMPRSFRFPDAEVEDPKAVWLPVQPTTEMQSVRGFNFFGVIATLKPGITLAQTQSELNAIAANIRAIDTDARKDFGFRVSGYQKLLTGSAASVFLALSVALGFVLLIACANVANLLIARCLGRRHEFAVRVAIGASRTQLMRQLIVEGGALSTLGAGLGFVLAELGVMAVHKLPPDLIPRSEEIGIRWTVVLVLAGIATIATILSALLPALLAGRTDPQQALQGASRSVGTRSVRGRLSGGLIAAEVALSVVLLIATGLLFRTLLNLQHVKLGFDVTRVSSFTAMPADAAGFTNMSVSGDNTPASSIATLVYQPVLERLRSAPGVQDAALITAPPLAGINLGTSFEIAGQPHDREHPKNARVTAVSGGYAGLMGTPVLRGRMIGDDDGATAPYVIAINDTLARTYFPGADPIGKELDLGGKETGMMKPYTIVGVMGDQVDTAVSTPPRPLLMIPYRQIPTSSIFYQGLIKTMVNFVVKTRTNVAIAPMARDVFKQIAPGYAVEEFRTMQEAVDKSSFSQRLGLYLTGAFAGLAVLMVVVGLYGVMSQLMGYRRREFGIRLALGATSAQILRMVLGQALRFVVVGAASGMALAFAAGKSLQPFLYGVPSTDAATTAAVILLLLFAGAAAALVPARRASATQPVETLRE
jgi:putative ABC transport system permease protein